MIDNFTLFGYLLIVMGIGLWAGRNVSNIRDYATSQSGFGPFVICATLSASFIGGGFSFGNAEKVFLIGIANIVALWGFSLKEIFVAVQIAPRMARFKDAISVGDIMASSYGKPGRVITGICGVILCCGIVGAQVGAVGYIFQNLFGLDRLVGIALGCSIVIIYTAIGGMKSVIYTDVLQYTLLAVGLPLVL
ncbi:MAG: sodium:solute symporter family protein, partial [Pseudomonadota bacterium]